MVRIPAARRLGALALASSVIALGAAASARAEGEAAAHAAPAVVAAQETAPVTPTPVTIEALPPSETPAAVAPEPPPPAAPVAVAAPVAPVPVSDPILVAVRDRLTKPVAGADKADMAALTAFYAARTTGPVWVADGKFSAAAEGAMGALRTADDWGLEAKAFALPELAASADAAAQAQAEVTLSASILKYARYASGGRVDPSTLSRVNDQRGTFADPAKVLEGVSATSTPGAYLEALHPQHPQFLKLREVLVKLRHDEPAKAPEPAPEPAAAKFTLAPGPALKPGVKNADIAAIREHLGVAVGEAGEETYDKPLVKAVKAFQEEHGLNANGMISNATRAALSGGVGKVKVASGPTNPAKEMERIALNMERWRWLPADLGSFHIENNIPEFVTRVYDGGKLVHQEKIVVGKPDTPTSVFSANMQFVIFAPEWGVPDSIKVKELLPYLRRKTTQDADFFGIGQQVSDTRILQRQNLRVSYNGKPVDASQIDWSRADPRAYQFIQASGGQNVLGVVKFRFPNRHDIYMHDTPQRDLFNETRRAYSHGCMRVHNPEQLAAVILAHDRGWTPERVNSQIASHQNLEVKVEKQFPVHVTYFTARVDESGKLLTFNDLYGHDAKLVAALAGRPVQLEPVASTAISRDDGTLEPGVPGGKQARNRKGSPKQEEAGLGGLLNGLFGN